MRRRAEIVALIVLASAINLACGAHIGTTGQCALSSVSVSPPSATADHAAVPPANSQQFLAFGQVPAGCATIQSNLTNVTWSVSDPANISISNTADQTFGRATCTGATAAPATVTATAPAGNGTTVKGTATLTCK